MTGIGTDGVHLRVNGRELFLGFDSFPWFRNASPSDIRAVEAPHRGHLRWPRLDVDLTIDSIDHPDRYPLTARTRESR